MGMGMETETGTGGFGHRLPERLVDSGSIGLDEGGIAGYSSIYIFSPEIN